MRKAKDIVGLPLLTLDTGKKLESVKDLLFDPAQNRVLALLIDEGGWFEKARVVPFEAVRSIGPNAVVIQSEAAIIPAAENMTIKEAIDQRKVITKMHVFTEDGRDLGQIDDVDINLETGEVKGYEVSGGLFANTLKGKRFIPAPNSIKIGRDVVFVSPEVGNLVEQQVTGGLQKQFEEMQRASGDVTERASGLTDRASEFAQRTSADAGRYSEQLKRGIGRASEEMRRIAAEQQKRFVIGRVAGSAVVAPDGTVIVAEGEQVTKELADEAERLGALGALTAAVGGTGAREVAGSLREQTGRTFEDIKRSITDFTREQQQRNLQRRIENAVGRPTNRVILDQNDQVILNASEVVTHSAIERARVAGVLDMLLSSVSTAQPSPRVMRGEKPLAGEESVEHQQEREERQEPTA